MNRGSKALTNRKKPRNGDLTPAEKRENQRLSKLRVVVEHGICGAKRMRCVKDKRRNWRVGFEDDIMVIACALHNLRVRYRLRPLRV
mgnify:CR=1 FL=1